jgi:predicted ATPase
LLGRQERRHTLHAQIAEAIEHLYPAWLALQPELLARHYTEAGRIAQAMPYWQRAEQKAIERSVYAAANAHLTKGLELLNTLPDTPERAAQELTLQTMLGQVLTAARGQVFPEVERAYTRAWELCRQMGESPQLLPALSGLRRFYFGRGEIPDSP